jgi:hypothetical protein
MRRGILLGAIVLAGCVSTAEPFQKAVLTSDIEEARMIIGDALAEAMGVNSVRLGADDLAGSGVVSVLPPRLTDLETASPVMPRQFWLATSRHACYLIEHQEGPMEDRHGGLFVRLDDIACRAVLP